MRIVWILAKAAISAGILWMVVRSASTEALGSRLHAIDTWAVVAVIAINLIQHGLGTYRWSIITGYICPCPRFGALFRFWMIGQFLSQALPSTVGGDGVRIWLLYRSGATPRDAAHSVLTDRISGLLVLLLVIAAALPFQGRIITDPTALLMLRLVAAAGLAGLVVLLMLAGPWGRLLSRYRLTRLLRDIAQTLLLLFSSASGAKRVFLAALLTQFMSVVAIYVLARSFDLPVSLIDLLILVPPTQLLATVPISIAGWGVREGLMVTVLAFVGVPADGALVLSVCYGLSLMMASLPGGIFLMLQRLQRERPAATADDRSGVAAA